jgi:hypothetical protein
MHIVPCYEGQTLATHARGMAPAEILEEHAARIRSALSEI